MSALWQAVRIISLQELNQFFPHKAAQVPRRRSIRRTHQGPQLQGAVRGVGHLQC
jgi:hypothetical protein